MCLFLPKHVHHIVARIRSSPFPFPFPILAPAASSPDGTMSHKSSQRHGYPELAARPDLAYSGSSLRLDHAASKTFKHMRSTSPHTSLSAFGSTIFARPFQDLITAYSRPRRGCQRTPLLLGTGEPVPSLVSPLTTRWRLPRFCPYSQRHTMSCLRSRSSSGVSSPTSSHSLSSCGTSSPRSPSE